MIEVRVYTVQEGHEKNVPALENAVMDMRAKYPELANHDSARAFDRFFELTHGVRIIQGPPCFVIWDDDREYTRFLLEWS